MNIKKALVIGCAFVFATAVFADPYVYDVSFKVKTTIPKKGKVNVACILSNATSTVTYRKQGTIKLAGLIWGCKCESLMGPLSFVDASTDGCRFWNISDKKVLANAKIQWPVLHRIDKKMKKAEGVMLLEADDWNLVCAGFGTVGDVTDLMGYLKNMKGNFAGWRTAPTWTETTYGVPCTFCESGTADITQTYSAIAWALCSCAAPSEKTAAFGSWTIRYNRNISANLNDAVNITDVYKFPSYVSMGN